MSDDYISRQAVLDAITEIDEGINMDIYTNEVREIIEDLPSVQPKTGHWKSEHTGYYRDNYNCSKCGFTKLFNYNERYNYCPNRGACMKDCRTLDEFIEDSKESEELEMNSKDTTIKKVKGFSSAYPNVCNLKLLPNIDGTWITIQDDVGTSMTIKLSDLSDFICGAKMEVSE